MVLSLVPFRALADDGKLTAEDAIKTLQSINPNIANYDIKTHLVTFKNGSKPVYVTPKGEYPQNGEVTWDYFIEQKGDLRGWSKMSPEEIISRKSEFMIKSGFKNPKVNTESLTYSVAAYASATQYPQERCAWCGVAATKTVLSTWSITSISQLQIAQKEYGFDGTSIPAQCACYGVSGVSEDAIAYALNGYIFNQWVNNGWYAVSHFSDKDTFLLYVKTDVDIYHAGLIFCGYTEHLPAWNKHHTVHYTSVYGYSLSSSTISYTDSANGLYKYCGFTWSSDGLVNYEYIPAYNTVGIDSSYYNSYYQYAYPYPAVA
ncbi:hypothetical protein [Caldisericum sp.]|uniref:hypothetical protein n=1 Tax=Caldisericum sp. TaxID=2499687 RepID=UPI003D12F6CB